jgi:cell division protein FtsQ
MLPVLVVAAIFGAATVSRLPFGQGLNDGIAGKAIALTAALGLTVDNIEVEGRETTDSTTIMAALAADRGTPILLVSPSRAREQLQALPWVRSAVIERRLPGTLHVRLVERKPLAIWQHNGVQQLIDREGAVIPVKELDRFAKLPIVVGDDAAKYAAALVDMLTKEPELAARVAAAMHVGGRRWNLRIDSAIDVLLPENDPAAAWTHLAQLERSNGLLKRDVQIVDLRFPDRLILRVNTQAPKDAAPVKKTHAPGKST